MRPGAAVEPGPVSASAAVAARNAVAATQDAPIPAPAVVAPDALRCDHCGRAFVPASRRRGSPPRFCCPAHREAARLRRERGLPEDHPVEPNRHGRRRLAAGRAEVS